MTQLMLCSHSTEMIYRAGKPKLAPKWPDCCPLPLPTWKLCLFPSRNFQFHSCIFWPIPNPPFSKLPPTCTVQYGHHWPQVSFGSLKWDQAELGCAVNVKHTGFWRLNRKKRRQSMSLRIFYIDYMWK